MSYQISIPTHVVCAAFSIEFANEFQPYVEPTKPVEKLPVRPEPGNKKKGGQDIYSGIPFEPKNVYNMLQVIKSESEFKVHCSPLNNMIFSKILTRHSIALLFFRLFVIILFWWKFWSRFMFSSVLVHLLVLIIPTAQRIWRGVYWFHLVHLSICLSVCGQYGVRSVSFTLLAGSISFLHILSSNLTHWGRDKMDAISQTTFSNAFSWMKMHEFRLQFHWSVFLRFE